MKTTLVALNAAALLACAPPPSTSTIASRSPAMPPIAPSSTPSPPPKRAPISHLSKTSVLDSFLTYRAVGDGPPVVFLHGNPTSSYVWRNVLPQIASASPARALAPDLIGMGDSGKPPISYRYADHIRYLDAWFAALDLRDVVVVGYDWGGVLAADWASRHADRVRGIVLFETFLRPMQWSDFSPQGAELFRALRTPGAGEAMVLDENQFLSKSLANGVKRGLAEVDRQVYYAPYPTPASRLPLLQWPREIPIDGAPADVADVILRNGEWLSRAPIPKLLLTFDSPGLSNAPPVVAWARTAFSNLTVVPLGAAGHHAAEDAPDAIAQAITRWLPPPSLGGHL